MEKEKGRRREGKGRRGGILLCNGLFCNWSYSVDYHQHRNKKVLGHLPAFFLVVEGDINFGHVPPSRTGMISNQRFETKQVGGLN